MKVYLCRKCRALVVSEGFPASAGCPAGGAHLWHRLCKGNLTGGSGLNPYICKKCGVTVYCSSAPSSAGCPAGGGHLWTRL